MCGTEMSESFRENFSHFQKMIVIITMITIIMMILLSQPTTTSINHYQYYLVTMHSACSIYQQILHKRHQKKRDRKDGSAGRDGAAIYKRPLHSVTQIKYQNIFLSENQTLSLEQNKIFFEIVAMLEHQQVQSYHMARKVVQNWNYQYSMYILHNGTGFGGK